MTISGSGIPASTTILSIDSSTQITMSANATNGGNNTTLTVTGEGSAGGDEDPDYSPSYLSGSPSLQNPGQGGEAGDVNGRGGAVILKW